MPYKDPKKHAEAQKRHEAKKKQQGLERHRVWTGIFYPDSAPPESEWREYMSQMHLKIWVSPPHDRDTWTEADERQNPQHVAGMPKKNHRHYLVQYENQVDLQTFLSDFAFLNGARHVKAVKSLVSMVRYLVHADDPDKAQYDKADVLVYGGADLDLVEQLGSHERREAIKAMIQYIKAHNITDFCDFMDYCADCEMTWWGLLVDNSSYVIEKYIKSRRYKLLEERRELEYMRTARQPAPKVNPATGELLGEGSQG